MFKFYTSKQVKKQIQEINNYYQIITNSLKEEKEKQYIQIKNEIKNLQDLMIKLWTSNINTTYKNGIFTGYPILYEDITTFHIFSLSCILNGFTVFYGKIEVHPSNSLYPIARLDFSEINNETVKIEETTVDSMYWRKGIGSMMVYIFENIIKAYNYNQITGTIIDTDYERAEPFWRKNGYQINKNSLCKKLN